MTSKQIFQAVFTALSNGIPSVVWQQARQDKPAAAVWGCVTFDGESAVSVAFPGRQYVYYRIWIYSTSPDETDLITLATAAKTVLNNRYIAAPNGAQIRFMHVSTAPVFWAEEYQARGIDITFRAITTSI